MRGRTVLFLSAAAVVAATGVAACTSGGIAATTSGGSVGGSVSSASSTNTTSSSGPSSVAATSTSTSGAGGSGGSGVLLTPPDAGPLQPPTGTTTTTFAITKLYLGDTDPDGTSDPTNGWKHYGYNIDGVPSSYFAGFCSPVGGADLKTLHTEGIGGVQNAWGHLILPALIGLSPNVTQSVNASLAAGSFSALISLDLFGPGASDNPLQSSFVPGGNLGHPPKLDGTDVWPVYAGFTLPLLSYVTANTWVTTTISPLTLYIPGVLGFGASSPVIGVTVRRLVMSMQIDAAHKKVTNGILSGVITTADLVAAIQAQAGQLNPSYCDPSGQQIQNLIAVVQQASDIMYNGIQNPLSPCDGITIGLGFEASVVTVGDPVIPEIPVSPCSDGGVDGGADGGADSGTDSGPDASTTSGAGGSDGG